MGGGERETEVRAANCCAFHPNAKFGDDEKDGIVDGDCVAIDAVSESKLLSPEDCSGEEKPEKAELMARDSDRADADLDDTEDE